MFLNVLMLWKTYIFKIIILLFECSKVSLFLIAFFATRHATCFGSFGQGDLNVLPICFVSNTLFLNIYLTCVTSIARHASICGDVILNEAVGKSRYALCYKNHLTIFVNDVEIVIANIRAKPFQMLACH